MLATFFALHLMLAAPSIQGGAQGTPPAEAGPEDWPYETPPGQEPPPAQPPPPAPPPRQPAPRVATSPQPGTQPRLRQLSLLSAEPLGGGSATLAWAGWSSVGIAWAQGLTLRDDLGAFGDLDWAKTELRLGGFYRRPLGAAGGWDIAGRFGLAYYANYGGEWVHDDNHHDRGVELSPALVLSARAIGGIVALSGEAPVTVTVKHDAGMLFTPRFAASYETPLYDEVTVGVRAALGYRVGAGDAPLRDGMADLQFLVLAGYQVL
ncbi:hypothetical protein [Anaeromyxobacter sp. Fw109-5]|uniref:hypothetical protein n=1 Tax=Anaeromyxobacter sp. (strain Fw109-5) TaxID=404589 RepID=UPI0000ED780C|nr:hypothetical protein [Anaeromyxobacter sp. Fw109-5]